MPRSGSSGRRSSGGSRSRSSSRSAPRRSYATNRGSSSSKGAPSRPSSTYTAPNSSASTVPVAKQPASQPAKANETHHVVEMRGPGLGRELASSMTSGLGLGMGMAAGQAVVGGIAGAMSHDKSDGQQQPQEYQQQPPQYAQNGPIPAETMNSQNPCFEKERELWKCINDNPNDIQVCQFYKDAFEQCRLAGNF